MKRSSRRRRSLAGFSLLILALLAVAGASALVVRFAPPWLVSTSGLTGTARLDELSRVRIVLLALVLGALAAAVATYLFRTSARERREESHERALMERFMRAVDQLGHPALDVRLGGIYSLERLARESPENHGPIIEILAAFVREHAHWPARESGPFGDVSSHAAGSPPPTGARGSDIRPRPPTDVEAAVTIIGRRVVAQDTDAPISLSRTALAGATLTGAHLERALLSGANLEGADLFKAHLNAADLEGANLRNAGLLLASLNDTVLWGVNAEGARLYGASLEGAALKGANLKSAGLTGANLKDAGLHSADLSGADLTGANLEGAGLEGANLEGANLQGANMRGAVMLNALYDETTIWPNGFDAAAQGAVSRAWQQERAARLAEPQEAQSFESDQMPSPGPEQAQAFEPEEGPPPAGGWPHDTEDTAGARPDWPPPPPTAGWPHETQEAPRTYSDWPPAPRQAPAAPEEGPAESENEAQRHGDGWSGGEDDAGAWHPG
jgi:uncharacterized protein YjbI with pentapeptide repeats/membrane protein implicated in regulation of membrane protease activity